jgi:hypothetical protein
MSGRFSRLVGAMGATGGLSDMLGRSRVREERVEVKRWR